LSLSNSLTILCPVLRSFKYGHGPQSGVPDRLAAQLLSAHGTACKLRQPQQQKNHGQCDSNKDRDSWPAIALASCGWVRARFATRFHNVPQRTIVPLKARALIDVHRGKKQE
jgi:hypothetical protein